MLNRGTNIWLYYIGSNIGVSVPYRNSIGLAISKDGGLTFKRAFEGPILDRTYLEPHFVANSCVLIENGIWRMWYLSTVRWEIHDGRPEPHSATISDMQNPMMGSCGKEMPIHVLTLNQL